jgi:MYXO-CTERM domain-containing protein
MQTGEGVVALWVLGALWLISRRRRVASPAGAM